jgi:hypothetical protein
MSPTSLPFFLCSISYAVPHSPQIKITILQTGQTENINSPSLQYVQVSPFSCHVGNSNFILHHRTSRFKRLAKGARFAKSSWSRLFGISSFRFYILGPRELTVDFMNGSLFGIEEAAS